MVNRDVHDIENIPDNWKLVPLSKTAKASNNSFIDGDWIEAPYIQDSGIRLVQTGNIGIGRFVDNSESRKFISFHSFNELNCKWVYPEDVLICRLADPIGRACSVPKEIGHCVTSVDCTIYRPDENKVTKSYVLHLLNFETSLKQASTIAGGSTRQRISRSNLGEMTILVPPLPEQHCIAEILDTIDEAIQKTEALISKLKAMKQGLLHDLLTSGLDKNGKLRDPKAHLIPFSDVVQVNPKTELYGLNDTTNVSFIPMSDVSESGQWVIRQTRPFQDVRNGYTCFKENDILFAKITPCMENGKGGHAIGLVNAIGFGTTEFHVLRAGAEIEPRYIYYWTMTEELRRKAESQMTGSAGQRRVPAEFFDNFKIPLFPHSEQRKIVEILDAHDARIRTEEQYSGKLKLQKKGLMHDLLTGKVRAKV